MDKNVQLTAAQQQMVVDNMKFATDLALTLRGCGVELDDLRQESLLGLCEAAARYDASHGCEFSTYAYLWCRKRMFMAIERYGLPMRVPRELRDEFHALRLDLCGSDADDDDGPSGADRIVLDVSQSLADEDALADERREAVEHALLRLPSRQREAIVHLFGLDGVELSGCETAKVLGVSAARVCTLQRAALERLQRMQELRELRCSCR